LQCVAVEISACSRGRRANQLVSQIGLCPAERPALPKWSFFPRRDLKIGQRVGAWLTSHRALTAIDAVGTLSGIDEPKETILLRERTRALSGKAGRKLISAAAPV